ncbi:MAG: hypothetical protein PVF33_02200 [Candidatus Latescibacterota bacterium]
MNNNRARNWIVLFVLVAGLGMTSACGGGDGSKSAVVTVTEERDGDELMSLMEGAKEAVRTNDFDRFQAQFEDQAAAKLAWDSFDRLAARSGRYQLGRFAAFPGLVRAQTGLHVSRVELMAWFDLSRETERRGDVYRTAWSFARADSAWTMDKMRINRAHSTYHELLRDLQQLSYREYLTLQMDWEELVDPLPLMKSWLEAAQREDYKAIESRMVAGVYPRAFEMNIDLPTLAAGERRGGGRENRESAKAKMESSMADLREAAGKLGLDPVELEPFFGAYAVTSMPENCTKLTMVLEFEGDAVPEKKVRGFTVEWSAAYINHRWLIEDMQVKTIEATF